MFLALRADLMAVILVLLTAGSARAQATTPSPAPTPKPTPTPAPAIKKWTAALSLGATITRGNKDTTTYNAGYDLKYDAKKGNVLTTNGLFIRGISGGTVSTNRLTLNARDERVVNSHFFVFVQGQFLRDQFKEIDYLVAPTAGLGLKAIETVPTKLSVNAGVGNVWEKNAGRSVRGSGALTIGERLTHAISPAVTMTQSFNGLWKTENFEDALLTASLGFAATMTAKMQFKVEWIDTYKSRPPSGVKKNDLSVIVALVVRH